MLSNIIKILTVTYNQLKCILAEQKTISKNVFCPQTFEKSTQLYIQSLAFSTAFRINVLTSLLLSFSISLLQMETDSVSIQIFKYAHKHRWFSVPVKYLHVNFWKCGGIVYVLQLQPNLPISLAKCVHSSAKANWAKVYCSVYFFLWTYIMMISSVKAVPNQKAKKHSQKKRTNEER